MGRPFQQFALVLQFFRRRHVERHRKLVLEAGFIDLERGFERKDGRAMLDGDHAAGGEGAAVADAVDLVDDRHPDVAGPHEIAMQRMYMPIRLDRTLRSHQRLRDRLAAEDALPVGLGAATSEQVVFQLLQVENAKKLVHGRRHVFAPLHR